MSGGDLIDGNKILLEMQVNDFEMKTDISYLMFAHFNICCISHKVKVSMRHCMFVLMSLCMNKTILLCWVKIIKSKLSLNGWLCSQKQLCANTLILNMESKSHQGMLKKKKSMSYLWINFFYTICEDIRLGIQCYYVILYVWRKQCW